MITEIPLDFDWLDEIDVATEMDRRYNLLVKIGNEKAKQADVMVWCKHSILDWVSNFVWMVDPRTKAKLLPIVLFEEQKKYLLWRRERRSLNQNGLCEKSRDAGVSVLNICDHIHAWLFEPGYIGGFGSRKEMYVDRLGDPSSLFEKMRILLRHLPKWMLPEGFNWKQHDCFCKLINPANDAVIVGEAGDSIGRGGRTGVYDWDEVAFTPHAESVDAALSNNTNVLFYTSSANGFNYFYQKRSQYPNQWISRIHWLDDPRKNTWILKDDAGQVIATGKGRNAPKGAIYPWFEDMCVKYDAVIIASEVNIDYGASVEGIYIPSIWVQAAIDLDLPRSGSTLAALDVARSGKNSNVLGFREGPVCFGIEDWRGLDTTQTAHRARERCEERSAIAIAIDADGLGAGSLDTLVNTPELRFEPIPIHGSGSPSDRYWEGEKRSSKEKFYNARAERWGLLHYRFKKTYDHVNGFAEYPLDELISIPNRPKLIAQISQAKRKFAANGKILVESKEEMEARGLESPDEADMLSQLYWIEQDDVVRGVEFESVGERESIAALSDWDY